MRFHWYWPFAREEELGWAKGTVRPGETILVQTIDRSAAPSSGDHGDVRVLRDLPDVNRNVSRLAWLPSRMTTYARRAVAREAVWNRERFDLVHLHYINRFTDGIVRLPHPLVISVHDVTPHQPRLGLAERVLLKSVYGRGDALIVHHEALKDRLASEFGVEKDVVHVVPHQVFPAPDLGAPPSDRPPAILFFGALRPNKGLEVLVEAFGSLKNQDVRLIIAGRGDAAVEAQALRAAKEDPRITAELGFISLERKHQLFADASVIALPYTSFASQSGVLHDAYAQGRPVVVTEVGALGSSVREDGTGVVCRPGEPRALASAISAALIPNEYRRYALAAQRVRRDRSPVETGMRLRSVYDRVLARRGL